MEGSKMNSQTSKGLSIVLLVYAVYSILYGLLHVISPELMMAKDPAIERVLGTAFLAFALGAGLAYLERDWKKVKILVVVQAAWMLLYSITMAWGILVGGIPALAWMPTLIGTVFAVLLSTLYIREKRIQG
jgi:divalent metal cation (Fe/Co/Zn/Cd) transporter